MKAEIINVGTELLLGQILNTNAQFLSMELSRLGIDIYFQTVVGDNQTRLKETFNAALNRADIIILTGGIGPTKDDLTKETVAEALSLPLEQDKESLKSIEIYFEKIHRKMCLNNKKQAFFPKGSIIIPNKNGTAPGCIIEKDNNIIIILPGPPLELQAMFKNYVYNYLLKKTDKIIYSKVLNIFGIGESLLEERLSDIFEKQTNPTIAPYANQGILTLRITAKAKDEETAKKLIEPMEAEIRKRIGTMIYGEGDETLESLISKLLINRNISIATAESCTGGLFAEKLTRMPGISKVFSEGLVTYSNNAKINLLNVSPSTLDEYGAVSHQTVIEMAEGIKEKSKSDIGIAITGIAGPDGGTKEKPVGTVYIGLATDKISYYKKYQLTGNRDRVRNITVMHAFDMLREHLIDKTSIS